MKRFWYYIFVFLLLIGCSSNNNNNGGNTPNPPDTPDTTKDLTIYFINDQHGQLDNFAKIKYIVDEAKESTNVIVACSGDIFSGNPVVDNYPEKGFPMIDIMNQVGFDVSVIGNHEFDYGEAIFTDRVNQANFQWVCANVDMSSSTIPQSSPYTTVTVDDIKVTFLGLVETNGKDDDIIPSTHPWRVQNLTFQRPEDVIAQYSDVKEQEGSDLMVALTHLGYQSFGGSISDSDIANQFPYFDLILGGHSHQIIDDNINGIPIYQSGSNLNYLGKAVIKIKDKTIQSIDHSLLNLNNYFNEDDDLKAIIDDYNNLPYLTEIIGNSQRYHNRPQVGCFYTDALRGAMNVDFSIQNSGGIRSDLNEGNITVREIFEISPFNNGTMIYSMTVAEIKNFLRGSGSGFYYSGIHIDQVGNTVEIRDINNSLLADNVVLTLGTNDYIPAVHDSYFTMAGDIQTLTAAETLIYYLENINSTVDYPSCSRYFRFQ
ncbi:bifunctional UDP-sugar hydrolase/5'-nucleotidase [Yeosuana sp. MJ-SS3]|uniref:Bifunctional UDP-sugar hydrolase/5'-nucleotidase n=1 Tax=Gilvirhabdus luticola TaxID=3079858 RepID=A0ABU3U9D8_9FLAO|nr:bifunctional UDP-sugar hydrolase/5'-nucleotidase [Yeosuana sp. MJ-SS3]MDU8887034.1 bifunctional UDP-sugar hydrolase/5'-nucleotidase [Yeosuana sp. MJ-SS3]